MHLNYIEKADRMIGFFYRYIFLCYVIICGLVNGKALEIVD